ncbi:pyridoxamine 5'-phosphate oxidase family protein [Qipengyuania sp. ASV99]|uniref:pyridoxamine 5'-phosphate oxidase family protein n=1 Tax=Qipengyuania sp. ASV99 TaxID=3399681 RepID=UPI003A4C6984
MFESLEKVQIDLVERLAGAAKDRKSPMHVPTVVTSDVDARIMVLRAFDSAAWTLRFHTDTRAPKVAAIRRDPRMAVLLYDQRAKVQIRVRGQGRILCGDPIVDAAWAASDNFARRCYLGDGPGTPSDTPTSGLPPEFEGVEPTDAQLVPARANFAVLLVEIEEIDWFYLAHTGHVRARFERDGGAWQGSWVSP